MEMLNPCRCGKHKPQPKSSTESVGFFCPECSKSVDADTWPEAVKKWNYGPGAAPAAPADATHTYGHQHYKHAGQDFYAWSAKHGCWSYIEPSAGRRAVKRSTPVSRAKD